jgi:ankyrin repeat protein
MWKLGIFSLRPLHAAVRRGDLTAVRSLLDAGVGVDAVDGDRRIALHYTARDGCCDLVKLLFSSEPGSM